ncbi:FUN14 domain-containing protein 1B-like isoform X1 [Bolinopsis microptera]|uniref:FUN14 domain-containing protein 1B-like isoform X1 n=1 Tax=Bolinopsis microptera TaxID=2820187 RepID=UPI00307A7C9D
MGKESKPTQQEIATGALAGICSGYLFKKVSKYAAATAVVGYLAVQGASQAGYIKINWKKVNDQIEDLKEACTISTAGYVKDLTEKLADLTDEISEIITDEDTLLLENEGRLKATARRAYEAFKQNAATSGSFTVGFALGILFA